VKSLTTCLALLVCLAVRLDGQSPTTPRGFRVDTVAAGAYAFVRLEPLAYGMQSNSLLLVGTNHAAVVDAQMNLTDTREVIAAVRRITTKPVRYVINTHCHDDHVTGNVEYRKAFPDVEFVASRVMSRELLATCARNRADFRRSGPGTVGFVRGFVDRNISAIGGPIDDEERIAHLSYARLIEAFVKEAEETVIPPTITFDRTLTLDLGNRRIDVLHLGPGHSAGDVIVRDSSANVIAAGDLVIWPVPFVGSTSQPGNFANALDSLLALRPAAILPGHGPLLRDTAYVHDVARMLKSIRSQVARSRANGDSLAATRRAVDLSEFRALFGGTSKLRLGLFDNYVRSSAIAAEYAAQAREGPPRDR
jgi:glyoxylase-like metal-dependent hydrolase (beta-lactamase superfamily II)